jgi:hypothetical protein
MEAIKKITTIRDGSIYFKELEKYNNQEVEILIFPLLDENTKEHKENLFKFKGAVASDFTDTSNNVDKVIYGG